MTTRSRVAGNGITNKKLMKDLKTLVHQAEEVLALEAGAATEASKEARTRLGHALEAARIAYEDIHDKAVARVESTNQMFHDHPYKSMGVAFGAGLILGALACRK
jgi:ElaB/YqjD/DUF883 family membrane-anchored ribosome-binding protein